MTNFPSWQDVRDDVVAGAGGEEAVAAARHRNQAYIDAQCLAERRKALGLTQTEVAERMGVTKSRVSQIGGSGRRSLTSMRVRCRELS